MSLKRPIQLKHTLKRTVRIVVVSAVSAALTATALLTGTVYG